MSAGQPIFVIDLDNAVAASDIEVVCAPCHYERIVRITEPHAASLEAMAVEAGVFSSRKWARDRGFSGPPPWGLELVGTNQLTFWVWNPIGDPAVCKLGKRRIKTGAYFAICDAGAPWSTT